MQRLPRVPDPDLFSLSMNPSGRRAAFTPLQLTIVQELFTTERRSPTRLVDFHFDRIRVNAMNGGGNRSACQTCPHHAGSDIRDSVWRKQKSRNKRALGPKRRGTRAVHDGGKTRNPSPRNPKEIRSPNTEGKATGIRTTAGARAKVAVNAPQRFKRWRENRWFPGSMSRFWGWQFRVYEFRRTLCGLTLCLYFPANLGMSSCGRKPGG